MAKELETKKTEPLEITSLPAELIVNIYSQMSDEELWQQLRAGPVSTLFYGAAVSALFARDSYRAGDYQRAWLKQLLETDDLKLIYQRLQRYHLINVILKNSYYPPAIGFAVIMAKVIAEAKGKSLDSFLLYLAAQPLCFPPVIEWLTASLREIPNTYFYKLAGLVADANQDKLSRWAALIIIVEWFCDKKLTGAQADKAFVLLKQGLADEIFHSIDAAKLAKSFDPQQKKEMLQLAVNLLDGQGLKARKFAAEFIGCCWAELSKKQLKRISAAFKKWFDDRDYKKAGHCSAALGLLFAKLPDSQFQQAFDVFLEKLSKAFIFYNLIEKVLPLLSLFSDKQLRFLIENYLSSFDYLIKRKIYLALQSSASKEQYQKILDFLMPNLSKDSLKNIYEIRQLIIFCCTKLSDNESLIKCLKFFVGQFNQEQLDPKYNASRNGGYIVEIFKSLSEEYYAQAFAEIEPILSSENLCAQRSLRGIFATLPQSLVAANRENFYKLACKWLKIKEHSGFVWLSLLHDAAWDIIRVLPNLTEQELAEIFELYKTQLGENQTSFLVGLCDEKQFFAAFCLMVKLYQDESANGVNRINFVVMINAIFSQLFELNDEAKLLSAFSSIIKIYQDCLIMDEDFIVIVNMIFSKLRSDVERLNSFINILIDFVANGLKNTEDDSVFTILDVIFVEISSDATKLEKFIKSLTSQQAHVFVAKWLENYTGKEENPQTTVAQAFVIIPALCKVSFEDSSNKRLELVDFLDPAKTREVVTRIFASILHLLTPEEKEKCFFVLNFVFLPEDFDKYDACDKEHLTKVASNTIVGFYSVLDNGLRLSFFNRICEYLDNYSDYKEFFPSANITIMGFLLSFGFEHEQCKKLIALSEKLLKDPEFPIDTKLSLALLVKEMLDKLTPEQCKTYLNLLKTLLKNSEINPWDRLQLVNAVLEVIAVAKIEAVLPVLDSPLVEIAKLVLKDDMIMPLQQSETGWFFTKSHKPLISVDEATAKKIAAHKNELQQQRASQTEALQVLLDFDKNNLPGWHKENPGKTLVFKLVNDPTWYMSEPSSDATQLSQLSLPDDHWKLLQSISVDSECELEVLRDVLVQCLATSVEPIEDETLLQIPKPA